MKNKKIISFILILAIALSVFAGCAKELGEQTGTLIIKVNPEISVNYNNKGLVTSVEGLNEDGKNILTSYSDYIGKPTGLVAKEIVKLINENGYFVSDVEKSKHQITLEITPESTLPSNNFLEDIASKVSESASEIPSKPAVIANNKIANNPSNIDEKKALEIALIHAGLKESEVNIVKRKLDNDNGISKYEFEFYKDNIKYEYDINSADGSIIKFSSKNKDYVSSQSAQSNTLLSIENAKEIAFKHAGVNADSISMIKTELDRDDGIEYYEIDFMKDNIKYEYDINAKTGEIIKHEKEQKNIQSSTPTQSTPSTPNVSSPDTSSSASKNNIGMQKAKEIALSHAGYSASSVYWRKTQSDYEDGRLIFEVDFAADGLKYEYDIDASNGNIIKFEKETDDDYYKYNQKNSSSSSTSSTSSRDSDYISRQEAINIALKHAGVTESQIRLDKAELDHDDGRVIYEVEFDVGNYEYEYDIDAVNGTILKVDIDD